MENSRLTLQISLVRYMSVCRENTAVTKEIPPLLLNEWALCQHVGLFITLYSAFTSWHQKQLIKLCDQVPFSKGLSAASRAVAKIKGRKWEHF